MGNTYRTSTTFRWIRLGNAAPVAEARRVIPSLVSCPNVFGVCVVQRPWRPTPTPSPCLRYLFFLFRPSSCSLRNLLNPRNCQNPKSPHHPPQKIKRREHKRDVIRGERQVGVPAVARVEETRRGQVVGVLFQVTRHRQL